MTRPASAPNPSGRAAMTPLPPTPSGTVRVAGSRAGSPRSPTAATRSAGTPGSRPAPTRDTRSPTACAPTEWPSSSTEPAGQADRWSRSSPDSSVTAPTSEAAVACTGGVVTTVRASPVAATSGSVIVRSASAEPATGPGTA